MKITQSNPNEWFLLAVGCLPPPVGKFGDVIRGPRLKQKSTSFIELLPPHRSPKAATKRSSWRCWGVGGDVKFKITPGGMKIQVYLHPPNTNMNTQKYGLEKVTPFYNTFYPFLVSMFNFWGLTVKQQIGPSGSRCDPQQPVSLMSALTKTAYRIDDYPWHSFKAKVTFHHRGPVACVTTFRIPNLQNCQECWEPLITNQTEYDLTISWFQGYSRGKSVASMLRPPNSSHPPKNLKPSKPKMCLGTWG